MTDELRKRVAAIVYRPYEASYNTLERADRAIAICRHEYEAEIARLRQENADMRTLCVEAHNRWRHEFVVEVEAATDKLFKRLSVVLPDHPVRLAVLAQQAAESGVEGDD